MLVRDLGDAYQIVLQPDHGRLSGAIARAWAPEASLDAGLRTALELAASRHDDGWAVWELAPRVDDRGRPQSFLEAPMQPLLSSYRACVDIVAEESELAGLLVSMYVSGLRRGRYGVFAGQPTVALEQLDPPVREFVCEEEDRQRHLANRLGVAELRWAYRLLQVFDVLSLHLGLADLSGAHELVVAPPPEALVPAGAPVGARRPLRVSPACGPRSVACAPFPFGAAPVRLAMIRRVVPKRGGWDDAGFRAALAAADPEEVAIEVLDAAWLPPG